MNTITQIAAQFNVDAHALQSFLDFFKNAAEKNEEIRRIIAQGTEQEKDALMRAAVEQFRTRSQAFYQEMLDNRTDRAKQWREDIRQSLIAKANNA